VLDTDMKFMRDFVVNTKRRFSVMLLLVFALSACIGPLSHAQFGEIYGTGEQSTSIAVSIDADHSKHGPSHDDEHHEVDVDQHTHDHNSADHSHEAPGLTTLLFDQLGLTPFDTFERHSDHCLTQSLYQIDRPPRV
jgi:hypothetical protein